MRLLSLFVAAITIPSLVACIVDSRNNNPPPSAGPAPTNTVPAAPMIVTVDTNQTMNAKGGDGVGVFVEYKTGGHWHVWMTCDTNTSNLDCDFDVKIAGTTVHNGVQTTGSSTGLILTQTPGQLEANVLMTTEVNGVTFDTDPGARITIDGTVSGLHSGDYFFWVQDGKVNGGYGGHLSNPLSFDPSQPCTCNLFAPTHVITPTKE
jgi:hypothetical protein